MIADIFEKITMYEIKNGDYTADNPFGVFSVESLHEPFNKIKIGNIISPFSEAAKELITNLGCDIYYCSAEPEFIPYEISGLYIIYGPDTRKLIKAIVVDDLSPLRIMAKRKEAAEREAIRQIRVNLEMEVSEPFNIYKITSRVDLDFVRNLIRD